MAAKSSHASKRCSWGCSRFTCAFLYHISRIFGVENNLNLYHAIATESAAAVGVVKLRFLKGVKLSASGVAATAQANHFWKSWMHNYICLAATTNSSFICNQIGGCLDTVLAMATKRDQVNLRDHLIVSSLDLLLIPRKSRKCRYCNAMHLTEHSTL